MARETTQSTTISPYHQNAVFAYSHMSNEKTPTKKITHFQIAWHSPVSSLEKEHQSKLSTFSQDEKVADHVSLSAEDGKFYPFKDMDLVKHLSLDAVRSIQYLDKSCSRWITHLRNSPAIFVTKDSILHLKAKDTEVSMLMSPDVKASIKREQSVDLLTPISSPEKRKSFTAHGAIDLTISSDEESGKRNRLDEKGASSPLMRYSRLKGEPEYIGGVPAKVNRFPAQSIGEMNTRLQWIADNQHKGSTEDMFGRVFNCKYSRSTYYNHRSVWLYLKSRGDLQRYVGSEQWMPVYSANASTALSGSGKGSSAPEGVVL